MHSLSIPSQLDSALTDWLFTASAVLSSCDHDQSRCQFDDMKKILKIHCMNTVRQIMDLGRPYNVADFMEACFTGNNSCDLYVLELEYSIKHHNVIINCMEPCESNSRCIVYLEQSNHRQCVPGRLSPQLRPH